MLEDCNVNGLIEFEKHGWVKLDLLIVTHELHHKSLIKDRVARTLHYLCREAAFQKADCDGHLLVWAHIDEVDKGVAPEHCAAHISLVGVQILRIHHAALTGRHRGQPLLLAVTRRD